MEPNPTTLKDINEAKKGKSKKYKSAEGLISFLNQ